MASNDPPTVAAVEHSEGASYVVDFGDPLRYPLPGDMCPSTTPYDAFLSGVVA